MLSYLKYDTSVGFHFFRREMVWLDLMYKKGKYMFIFALYLCFLKIKIIFQHKIMKYFVQNTKVKV